MSSFSTPHSNSSLNEKQSPNSAITSLLGQGLSYATWQDELETKHNITWTENLKNLIIKTELEFFRDEILELRDEKDKNYGKGKGRRSKTNSLETILKRLQGLEWMKGEPTEMDKRKREGRLLGSDTKIRCLQYHVSRWMKKADETRDITLTSADPTVSIIGSIRREHSFDPDSLLSSADSETFWASQPATNASFPTNLSFGSSNSASSFCSTLSIKPLATSNIFEDKEIPWVPYSSNVSTAQNSLVTPEKILHANSEEMVFRDDFSFELPRGNGVNDSFSTYISHVNQNPDLQQETLEGIFSFYGSQSVPDNDYWTSQYPLDTSLGVPKYTETTNVADQEDLLPLSGNAIFSQVEEELRTSSTDVVQPSNYQDQPADDTPPRLGSSLNIIEAELEEKRKQLLAAEELASNLRTDIERLEQSAVTLRHPLTSCVGKYSNILKRNNEYILRATKRLRHINTSPSLGSYPRPVVHSAHFEPLKENCRQSFGRGIETSNIASSRALESC